MNKENNSEKKYEVTPIELFFDLIYAFAFSQLSQYLLSDISWQGVIRTIIILLAIYMVWAYTSWAATMIRADKSVNTHWMILSVMFIGFVMNISAPEAFSNYGWVFITTFLIIQLIRTCWTIIFSPNVMFRNHFWRVLIWQIVSVPIWIIGACVSDEMRIALWLAAGSIDLLGMWLGHPIPRYQIFFSEEVEFDTAHLLERCRLFRLIAIGEMVFTLGAAISKAGFNYMTVVLGIVAMAEIVSLWGLTFGRFFSVVREHVENAENSFRASYYAIDVLVIILFGIIAISVANEHIIMNPFEVPSPVLSFLLGGGPILFLLAQGWYLMKIPKIKPYMYALSAFLILIVNIGACFFPAWVSLIATGIIIIILAILEF